MTLLLLAVLAHGPEPLPASLAGGDVAVGIHAGYLRIEDADEGTELYGAHVRWSPLPFLALEASVDAAEADVADGAAELSLVPVQFSVLLKPFDGLSFTPYLLAGGGWYFYEISFGAGIEDEEDGVFAAHVGAGLELAVGPLLLHADLRYLFLDPDFDDLNLPDDDFDAWQAAVGAAVRF